ncbi:MAG: glycosyltransferase family 4 protein [Patescibacteria group bacterium]|nr:glycosyltransferase family 4 protein [Patescibacteria group bacterium]
MRVLMFGWEFPPHYAGGLGIACKGLVRGLHEVGVDVTFVLPEKMDTEGATARIRFADPTGRPNGRPFEELYNPYGPAARFRGRLRFVGRSGFGGGSLYEKVLWYARQAGRIAAEEPHDVIHAHDWLTYLAGLEAKRVSGKPLVVHVHATEFDRTGGGLPNQDVYDIERLGFEAADAVVAISGFTKRILVERYGVPEDKIAVVHNASDSLGEPGVPPAAIAELKRQGRKIVLFVGRLTIQKGVDYLVRAARRVSEAIPEAAFVISGSGEMEGELKALTQEMGVADRFYFLGFLRGAELTAAYANADVFVMPSVSEPFGLTCLEAQSYGLPSVISRQSGVSEVARHCLKTDFWDVDDMAAKIIAILRYPALRETLAVEAPREVARRSWAEAGARCKKVYENLLSGH